jgi:DNA repair protein REV1
VYDFITKLAEETSSRMQRFKVMGKTITLKMLQRREDAGESVKYLGHGNSCTKALTQHIIFLGWVVGMSKSITLPTPTCDASTIALHCKNMYAQLLIPPPDVRGVGIHITKLEV